MAETRIYVVLNRQTGDKRMVEATSQEQAIRHCVHALYKADIASPKTVAFMMGEGLRIEKAEPLRARAAAPTETVQQTAQTN